MDPVFLEGRIRSKNIFWGIAFKTDVGFNFETNFKNWIYIFFLKILKDPHASWVNALPTHLGLNVETNLWMSLCVTSNEFHFSISFLNFVLTGINDNELYNFRNLKSVHFKKTVAKSSFLSKVLSFSLTLFWFQQKWQRFWKKWGSRNWVLKMNEL